MLEEPHIGAWGKFDAFFIFVCVLGDFLGEVFGILRGEGGEFPPEDSTN